MGLDVGDRLAIYSANSVEKMQASIGKTNAEVFLAEDFTIRGIFDVGFPDYNSSIIVTSLDDARELLKMPENAVQGLQVKLRDPFLAEKVAAELAESPADGRWPFTPGSRRTRTFSTRWRWKRTRCFTCCFSS